MASQFHICLSTKVLILALFWIEFVIHKCGGVHCSVGVGKDEQTKAEGMASNFIVLDVASKKGAKRRTCEGIDFRGKYVHA